MFRSDLLARVKSAADIVDFNSDDFDVTQAIAAMVAEVTEALTSAADDKCVVLQFFSNVIAAHKCILQAHPCFTGASFKGFDDVANIRMADITGVKETAARSTRTVFIKVSSSAAMIAHGAA
jgi:hypothetical protein